MSTHVSAGLVTGSAGERDHLAAEEPAVTDQPAPAHCPVTGVADQVDRVCVIERHRQRKPVESRGGQVRERVALDHE